MMICRAPTFGGDFLRRHFLKVLHRLVFESGQVRFLGDLASLFIVIVCMEAFDCRDISWLERERMINLGEICRPALTDESASLEKNPFE
jgi:hypothetical protein